jgi:hypothetical protein
VGTDLFQWCANESGALEPSVLLRWAGRTIHPGGYGVTSVELKIDGAVVNSATQTCPSGGCNKVLGSNQTLDMAQYSGGAHTAEFIAKDGAGNVRKRTWTINIDPEGHISASEAEDTLEALDATSPVNTVGPASRMPRTAITS